MSSASTQIHFLGLMLSFIVCATDAAFALSDTRTSTMEYACEPIIGSETAISLMPSVLESPALTSTASASERSSVSVARRRSTGFFS